MVTLADREAIVARMDKQFNEGIVTDRKYTGNALQSGLTV